jgi:hypothetical protein
MNSSKTIVKQNVNGDIGLRRTAQTTGDTPGRKVGGETRIEITPDRIRERAYEIFLARNGGPGDPAADWCQAERELDSPASSEPVSEDSMAHPAVVELKSRSKAQRQPAMPVRGEL